MGRSSQKSRKKKNIIWKIDENKRDIITRGHTDGPSGSEFGDPEGALPSGNQEERLGRKTAGHTSHQTYRFTGNKQSLFPKGGGGGGGRKIKRLERGLIK